MSQLKIYTQLYKPDLTTTAVIMSDLAEDLALLGVNVDVVCAKPTYFKGGEAPAQETINGVKIKRVKTSLFNKNNLLGRILNSSSCFVSMFFTSLVVHPNEDNMWLMNTNPALLPFLGYIYYKLYGRKYIVLVHDLWPELPGNMGLIEYNGFIYRLIDRLNTKAFENARLVVVPSNFIKQTVMNKLSEGEKYKVHAIHSWADRNRVYPIEKENCPLLKELGLEDKKIVMYSGNIGRYQPLEVMIEAARELRDRPDIHFIFAGEGGKKKKIVAMADRYNLTNVTFIPFQPAEKLSESLSMANISLMGIYPSNEGVIMPSKLYGLLAIGRPIICVSGNNSEAADMVLSAGAGLQSPVSSSETLARNIINLIDNPTLAEEMGKNAREYFLNHFERKVVTHQWYKLIKSILT